MNWLAVLTSVSLFVHAGCGSEQNNHAITAAVKTAKVMPLGDSITESSAGLPSYRFYLWQSARADGVSVDFVGSQRGVSGGLPLHADFDMDHEGHSGWRADDIHARIVGWATAASPDIVLIHLGHNDLCQGQDAASTASEIAGIVDALRTVNGGVSIVLAQIIASAHPCHATIPAFNAQLPALVAAKTLPGSPVVLVDLHTGFIPATMSIDGVHPNALGESHMAERWFAGLKPLLARFQPAQP